MSSSSATKISKMATASSSVYKTGDGRSVSLARITELYKSTFGLTTPQAGKIHCCGNGVYNLTVNFKTFSADIVDNVSTFKVYCLSTVETKKSNPVTLRQPSGRCIQTVQCISDHHKLSELDSASSINGRFLARLSSQPAEGSEPNQILEIWDRSRLIKTIDISKVKIHGPIATDEKFGCMRWSPFGEQDKLLYVCRRKKPKSVNYFECSDKPSTSTDSDTELVSPGDSHIYRQDWGENLDGIEHTMVAVLDVANELKITKLDIDGQSLCSTMWLDGGNKTISVAYAEEPRHLGLIYCNNRPSKLIIHDWTSGQPREVLSLSSPGYSFHTPRVNHSGTKFIYLANKIFGPHWQAVSMHLYDLTTSTDTQLIDETTNEAELFIDLPENCFSVDDNLILIVKEEYISNNMCLYNLTTHRLSKIEFPTSGLKILDFHDDIILAIGCNVNASLTLFVSLLDSANSGELVFWHQIEDFTHFEEIEFEAHKVPVQDGSEDFVGALLVNPVLNSLHKTIDPSDILVKDQSQLPTVVLLHGGPHSSFKLFYIQVVAFYVRLGLNVLVINYRGSTGVSQEYNKKLCGKIGQMDLEDCLLVIRHFVHSKRIHPDRLVIQGGSHGGFLAAHLSCQSEFKFTSAVIRNPVIDLSSLQQTSDIPDWCFSEGLGDETFDFTRSPTAEEKLRLFECSPMFKYANAYVPTFMSLGAKDRRVNMFQGQRWIDLLKARGIKTLCKVYQDGHALCRPEVMSDSMITATIWILKHL